jgi:hypothetical protein
MSIFDRFGGVYDSAQPVIEVPVIQTACLRAASPWLLNAKGSTMLPGVTAGDVQADAPGEVQPFPNTAAALIAALGATGVILPASVAGIYLCDTGDPLLDSCGLGPNLFGSGGELVNRECVGLGQAASFISKIGCEFPTEGGAERFRAAINGFGQIPAGTARTFGVVWRCNRSALAAKYDIMGTCNSAAMVGWDLKFDVTGLTLAAQTTTTAWADRATVVDTSFAVGWHCAFVIFDGAGRTITLFSDLGDAAPVGYAGDIDNAVPSFRLGWNVNGSCCGQIAYMFSLNALATSAMRAAFWRAFNLNEFSTPVAHTRAGPLIVPISASRVAAYGANQPAVGYNSNFVANGNALKTGVVCEDGITFEPIGSDNLFTNTAVAGCAKASVDGPSGMRDGTRITMAGAWAVGTWATLPAAGVAIVGASNIPWRLDMSYRRATVGTTAKIGLYFTGSATANERFLLVDDAATWVDWRRDGGTCTPANNDQTAVFVVYGCAANLDNCDFGEPAVVKNRTTAPLAWRRVGTAAAAATATPVTSITNVGNARFNPASGTAVVRIAGFQGTKTPYQVAGSPFATGAYPRGIAHDSLGQTWVTSQTENQVYVFNTRTHALIGTYATGLTPWDIAIDSLNHVWIPCSGSNLVTVYDAATLAPMAWSPLATGNAPIGVCVDGINQVWITDGAATVTVFNTITHLAVAGSPFAAIANCYHPSVDSLGRVWMTGGNQAVVYDTATMAPVAGSPFATGVTVGVESIRVGSEVWIADYTNPSLTAVFNAAALAPVAGSPFAFGAGLVRGIRSDSFGRVWLSDTTNTQACVVDAATRTVIARLPIVSTAGPIAVDTLGQIWLGAASAVAGNIITVYKDRADFLNLGTEGAAGSMLLDYCGTLTQGPMLISPAQLRLRLWDDAAALVCTLNCGALTTAEATRTIEWNAAVGSVRVLDGAGAVLATKAPLAVWTPEATAVTPLYIGCDSAGANAARCHIALLQLLAT